ncbi:MAG: YtxH domain-containing protein [Candidatus Longimicrobiales bacterium M2_2A_002]
MTYEDDYSTVSFVSGLLLGAALGSGLALILAPQSGRRTRRDLVRSIEDVADTAAERWDDVTDELRYAVRSKRRELDL